jgi:hypothetical protein
MMCSASVPALRFGLPTFNPGYTLAEVEPLAAERIRAGSANSPWARSQR